MPLETTDVTPLITAAEAYPQMEALAVAATRRIWLSFRVFDVATKLRTDEARKHAGGNDWAALLAARAKDGVDVRVQIADFDPIAAAALHEATWASLRQLSAANQRAGGVIEVIAARHPARLGYAVALALAVKSNQERRALHARYGDDIHEILPRYREHAKAFAPRIHPATHHHKLAVFDDAAIVGGLDVDERRWDTPQHDQPSPETWRDATLLVRGKGAARIAGVFADLWNKAIAQMQDAPMPAGLSNPTEITANLPPETGASDDFSLALTRSTASRNPFSFGPKTTESGTLTAALSAIQGAENFLYIETQFLRSRHIADALCAAARRAPSLELVIILPFAPERFAFQGRRDTPMKHAEALQLDAIQKIRSAFGDRSTVLSPAKPARQNREDAFSAYGAGIVYVHSKILIADGTLAIVGSANLNDRSLLWDTEVSAVWRNERGVTALHERLAESWLGADIAGDLTRAKTWHDAALANAAHSPGERSGFLLPHNETRAEKFSRRVFWLPNALF